MRARYFWPIILIVAGVLFLLQNLGWLPGSAWGWIWAIALILLGLSLLWPRRQAQAVDVSVPLEGSASARLTLKHGAGRLWLRAGSASDVLISGSFSGGVDKDVRFMGDMLAVTLRVPEQDWANWIWPGTWGRAPLDWNVNVNPSVLLQLALEVGASENFLAATGASCRRSPPSARGHPSRTHTRRR